MNIIRDEHASPRGLAIVDKYEDVVFYLYPILQRCPQRHSCARDAMMAAMFGQVALLQHAAKSGQVSKLSAADVNLATLRFWLRFASNPAVKIITPRQHRRALALLDETGRMLGTWINTAKGNG